MHCWTKYEKNIKQKVSQKKFDEVQFRSKVRGWGNFYVVIVVEGVKVFISNPKHDEFYSLFFSDHVLNDACSDCLLRSTMEYTDIRLGDFWGKQYLSDRKGTSAVAVATKRGSELFKTVASQFTTQPHKMSEVIAYQSYVFALMSRNKGIFYASPTTLSKSLAEVRFASLVEWA